MDTSVAQRLKNAACAWAAANLSDRGKTALFAQEVYVRASDPLRFDVAAYGADCNATIFEVKSSLADFSSDTKYQHYLRWCNCLYFVVPKGTVPLDRIPTTAGVLEEEAPNGKLSLRRLPQERLNAAESKELLEAIVFSAFFQERFSSPRSAAKDATSERPRIKYSFREIFGSPFAPHKPKELPDDIEIVAEDQPDFPGKALAAPSIDEFLNP